MSSNLKMQKNTKKSLLLVILVQRLEISTPETSPPHSPILLKWKKVLA